jgi:IclR helix-turn-helix domain
MTYRTAWAADPVAEAARDAATPRAVIGGAFGLLESLRDLGSARVSDLQRYCGLPRTTVHRLLGQLAEVGAVERSGARWRLGLTLIELGASVPAEPRLRSAARRPPPAARARDRDPGAGRAQRGDRRAGHHHRGPARRQPPATRTGSGHGGFRCAAGLRPRARAGQPRRPAACTRRRRRAPRHQLRCRPDAALATRRRSGLADAAGRSRCPGAGSGRRPPDRGPDRVGPVAPAPAGRIPPRSPQCSPGYGPIQQAPGEQSRFRRVPLASAGAGAGLGLSRRRKWRRSSTSRAERWPAAGCRARHRC